MGMNKMQLRHELIFILSESPGTDLVFQDPIIAGSVEEVTLGQREPLGIIMSCFLLQHLGPAYFSFSHRGSPPAKQKNLLVGVRFLSLCHASEIDAVASLKKHEKTQLSPYHDIQAVEVSMTFRFNESCSGTIESSLIFLSSLDSGAKDGNVSPFFCS